MDLFRGFTMYMARLLGLYEQNCTPLLKIIFLLDIHIICIIYCIIFNI